MTKKATIIDYGSGNLHSILKAFERGAAENNTKVVLSASAGDLSDSDYVILPGVGAFGDCVAGLEKIDGMMDVLNEHAIVNKKPFMGVCVGMQMLADTGLENGEHKGLGWIKGEVNKIEPNDDSLKIPHMGWNEIIIKNDHPVLKGINSGDHFYFVHSYKFDCKNERDIVSVVEYGCEINAVIANENIIATQFHPEKSHSSGIKLIENFLRL